MERDKVNSFWEITKRQLEEARSTIRNKERELEDSEERHQVEIKVGAGLGTAPGVFPLQCMRLRSMNTFIADTSLTTHLQMGAEVVRSPVRGQEQKQPGT